MGVEVSNRGDASGPKELHDVFEVDLLGRQAACVDEPVAQFEGRILVVTGRARREAREWPQRRCMAVQLTPAAVRMQ